MLGLLHLRILRVCNTLLAPPLGSSVDRLFLQQALDLELLYVPASLGVAELGAQCSYTLADLSTCQTVLGVAQHSVLDQQHAFDEHLVALLKRQLLGGARDASIH